MGGAGEACYGAVSPSRSPELVLLDVLSVFPLGGFYVC
jgi:hypothetical protein